MCGCWPQHWTSSGTSCASSSSGCIAIHWHSRVFHCEDHTCRIFCLCPHSQCFGPRKVNSTNRRVRHGSAHRLSTNAQVFRVGLKNVSCPLSVLRTWKQGCDENGPDIEENVMLFAAPFDKKIIVVASPKQSCFAAKWKDLSTSHLKGNLRRVLPPRPPRSVQNAMTIKVVASSV